MLDSAEEIRTMGASTGPRQHTLGSDVVVSGKGLLLGEDATVTIRPAPENHGIVFERVDLSPPVQIPASVQHLAKRARRTTLKMGETSIETIEHCMSALCGMRIDNALVSLDGPELPCGDGSAALFVEPMLEVGIVAQDAARKIHRISEPLLVQEGDAMLAAFPCDAKEFRVIFDLDYGSKSNRIKRQVQTFASSNGDFAHELSRARTYSLKEEAQALWDRGMCRHLTPKDVLVIGDDGPIDNAYRFDNEPVRHKILDLLGDLYLAGCEIQGGFVAYKSGHKLNRKMCLKIVQQMEAARRQDALLLGKNVDIRGIQRLLPHRYPMLLVDRIVHIEADKKAIGIKNVTINEPFFQGHYPGTPIMPGVLIVEAMAQLGGLLMSQKLEHAGKVAILLSLDKVKLRRPVTPGDQLVMEAVAIRAKPRTGTVKCKAYVGSELAAEAQIRFMMVDAEQE
ncbi:MAG: UDP-3-O-[3-hydroxymyristoyl] N-acetylglucosamine deacetylase [Planctomycetes bacterium]|nr:UDP-3-O-[3-hydroxymyristoyl] N-acetylglucosamine deacetylase [Planctomycetota bacterium]